MLPLISKSIPKHDQKCEHMSFLNTSTVRSEANLHAHTSRCMHNDNRNYDIKLKDNCSKDETPGLNNKSYDTDMHK